MKVISVITDPVLIDKLLRHVRKRKAGESAGEDDTYDPRALAEREGPQDPRSLAPRGSETREVRRRRARRGMDPLSPLPPPLERGARDREENREERRSVPVQAVSGGFRPNRAGKRACRGGEGVVAWWGVTVRWPVSPTAFRWRVPGGPAPGSDPRTWRSEGRKMLGMASERRRPDRNPFYPYPSIRGPGDGPDDDGVVGGRELPIPRRRRVRERPEGEDARRHDHEGDEERLAPAHPGSWRPAEGHGSAHGASVRAAAIRGAPNSAPEGSLLPGTARVVAVPARQDASRSTEPGNLQRRLVAEVVKILLTLAPRGEEPGSRGRHGQFGESRLSVAGDRV